MKHRVTMSSGLTTLGAPNLIVEHNHAFANTESQDAAGTDMLQHSTPIYCKNTQHASHSSGIVALRKPGPKPRRRFTLSIE
eukprot:6473656-Amphidinium_carterae.2